MCWKQHQQDFPRLTRMGRQYLTVTANLRLMFEYCSISIKTRETLKEVSGFEREQEEFHNHTHSPRHTRNILTHGKICIT